MGVGAKLARRAYRWLFVFELATGLYALGFPLLMRWLARQPMLAEVAGSAPLTIAATFALLVFPSLLIGFTIPLFAAYIKAYLRHGEAFPRIYAAYNFGALLAILGVEFLLVRHYGIANSLALAGAANVAIGLALLFLRPAAASPALPPPHRFAPRTLTALAAVSMASAVFQMFLLKLSFLVFGPHRENFAMTLAVVMLGITLGTILAARSRISFVTLVLFLPLAIGLIFLGFVPLVEAYQSSVAWFQGGELVFFLHKFAAICAFALAPMVLFGATLPVLMRAEREVAGEAGQLLFVAGTANAAGFLIYVSIGHPLLATGVVVAAIALFALAAAILATTSPWSKFQRLVCALGVASILLLLARFEDRHFYLAQWLDEVPASAQVTTYKSGAESATLIQSKRRQWVTYNGHPSILVMERGLPNQAETISGVIPALTAPRTGRALLLGLGTGITAGTTAQLFEHTDVAEINQAFFAMAKDLDYANHAVMTNRSAHITLADGRAYLIGKDGLYDAIVNTTPAPTNFSASKLYTREFYQRVSRALRPDGVFATWFSVTDMSEEGVETILAGLVQVFRQCDLYVLRSYYYMVTCSKQPLIQRRYGALEAPARLTKQLKLYLPGLDLDEFFEDIRLSGNLFARKTPRVARANTDDHPVLEYLLVRRHQLRQIGQDSFLRRQDEFAIDPVRLGQGLDDDRMARRAAAFEMVSRCYYKTNFKPLFKSNRRLFEAWGRWRKAQRQRD